LKSAEWKSEKDISGEYTRWKFIGECLYPLDEFEEILNRRYRNAGNLNSDTNIILKRTQIKVLDWLLKENSCLPLNQVQTFAWKDIKENLYPLDEFEEDLNRRYLNTDNLNADDCNSGMLLKGNIILKRTQIKVLDWFLKESSCLPLNQRQTLLKLMKTKCKTIKNERDEDIIKIVELGVKIYLQKFPISVFDTYFLKNLFGIYLIASRLNSKIGLELTKTGCEKKYKAALHKKTDGYNYCDVVIETDM